MLALSDGQLGRLDIVVVNLLCAEGLPGAETIDRAWCVRAIDEMAERVRIKTLYAIKAFERTPERWDHSPGIFRIHVMISALQREFGVRYNPAKIPLEIPLDTEDCFLHGIIQGQGGTCASLPVLYAAVGRRLGYPLKLVSAACKSRWMHLFVRWDNSNGERFNIEVNNQSFDTPPDDYYRQGNYKSGYDWEQTGSTLKSKTSAEELACFMAQRAGCWGRVCQKRQEVEALAWASALAPSNVFYREILKRLLNEWHEQLENLTPPGFPPLYIHHPPRRFPPGLPACFEHDIVGLTVNEFLLKDSVNIRQWWEPMRRGCPLPQKIGRIDVNCTPNGYQVQLQMSRNGF